MTVRYTPGATITADNVMVFAGGRPALIAILTFLESDIRIRIAETEYTPYWDMLERYNRAYDIVPSHEGNGFRPTTADYVGPASGPRSMVLLSNPCNPTGVTRRGVDLAALVASASQADRGVLVDEAYELFQTPPESALAHVTDIDAMNLFVVGAATKGLQAPGIRIGWVVASKANIEILGNFSSFGMGGVSHPSQRYALALLDPSRVDQARAAVPAYYASQRARYGEAFASLRLESFTGDGGFYHWCKLPEGTGAATRHRSRASSASRSGRCRRRRSTTTSPSCDGRCSVKGKRQRARSASRVSSSARCSSSLACSATISSSAFMLTS